MKATDVFLETYTGKYFYPLDPNPANIDIIDIAHALSMLCRFGGHCLLFYSVAEHSVRASQIATHDKLAILLHDAAEAYFADIAGNLKYYVSGLEEIERNILETIYRKFGINHFDETEVERVDWIMLATEARDLMHNTSGWFLPELPLAEKIMPVSPGEARKLFLLEFSVLRRGRRKE